MARQVLPVFWASSDVDALKKQLAANAVGTDLGVQACTAIPDAKRAAWGLFYVSVIEFTKESSSIWSGGAEANRGQAFEDALYTWQKDLKASGCDVVALDPQPAEAPGSSLVKWGALAVITAAAAYGIHQVSNIVLDVLPSRAKTSVP